MDNEKKKISHKPEPTTLREYIAHLRKYTRKYGDLPVVYSRDDEGNGFQHIFYTPTLGHFDDWGGEFSQYESNDPENKCEKEDINCICVN